MKILFIYPDLNYVKKFMPDYKGSTSIGLAYLSANIKKHGHDVSLFHITDDISKSEFTEQLRSYDFNIAGFTGFSNQNHLIVKYAAWVKEYSDVLTVYGGVHPTVDPEDAIDIDGIDIICIGEGEDALVELCNALNKGEDYSDISSFWIKKGKEITRNPVRQLRQDLDSLPFPDLSIFDLKSTVQWKIKALEVLSTRGCSYNCSYCCNHQYRKLYGASNYVRYRSVDNIIKEIKWRLEQVPDFNHIVLLDDTFGLKKDILIDFCAKVKTEIGLPWRTNTHAHVINEETIIAMKKSGCQRISIGIESGDKELRRSILNRKLDDDTIKKAAELCHKHGIEVMTYNMVGIPFETREKALKTIKLNADAKINPRLIHMSILQPYPKTRIYDICVKNGFISKSQVPDSYFSDTILDQPSMKRAEVIFVFEFFYVFLKLYLFSNRLPDSLKKISDKILNNIFTGSNPELMLKIKKPIILAFFPVQNLKKAALRYFPNASRAIKNKLSPAYKL